MRYAILTLLCTLLLGACSTQDKAVRDQQKALNARIDSIRAVEAMAAVDSGHFAVRFERLNFRHGGTFTVHSNINFAYVNGEKGAIQLASPAAPAGPNGIGGITLSGSVRNYTTTHNRKGDVTATYTLVGYGMTATVVLKMQKGSTDAHLQIDAGYSNAGMNADGKLSPYDPNGIVKGFPDL